MTRSRVFIVRSRSDQNREIESRDDNVSMHRRTQSRKKPELFELLRRLLVARDSRAEREMA